MVYLRPAREGDVLTLECEVSCGFVILGLVLDGLIGGLLTRDFSNVQTVNVGKRLALLKGVLRREDGALVSTCEHQMYNVDADTASKL